MDSRIAILGNNGTGKSTLLNLITGSLQPCEGTVSKHASLKLAKYSQHSADQLPYDKCPIEYFQSTYHDKFPDKDIMVRVWLLGGLRVGWLSRFEASFGEHNWVGSDCRVRIRRHRSS